jgi:hypothetical protein
MRRVYVSLGIAEISYDQLTFQSGMKVFRATQLELSSKYCWGPQPLSIFLNSSRGTPITISYSGTIWQ